ncbi:uncharacterized protein MELLADRAFT_84313 [Melampsora larici-populina 98AG31]|uniref:Uncharacterized protein n=1 Tax=Melampsora larici-populina (strain 98AG31 / pathotype 3-4-7) TaxID=747676 RepID=F4RFA6_MELLP|nr:uncharacterized protein MELLADRAFT_84313 [Melampsora larici-populina 98AG31]EGG08968.1 hypothetical protein MELLADRAFT_84313 [Melampsora larici-populina 98AG31]
MGQNKDDDEIEIENPRQGRLAGQHAALRQQIRNDPSHCNMDQRLNPTATHLMAANQARSTFMQAAAQGRENFEDSHRDPMLDHHRSTGNFSSALADPRQCGAQAQSKYHPECGILQSGSGSMTNDTPVWDFNPPNRSQPRNPHIIPSQTSNELPIKMSTLRVFHEAYLHGPKDKPSASTSRAPSKRTPEKLGWNCDKTKKEDTGPKHYITVDLNHSSPQKVIELIVTSLDRVLPKLAKVQPSQ